MQENKSGCFFLNTVYYRSQPVSFHFSGGYHVAKGHDSNKSHSNFSGPGIDYFLLLYYYNNHDNNGFRNYAIAYNTSRPVHEWHNNSHVINTIALPSSERIWNKNVLVHAQMSPTGGAIWRMKWNGCRPKKTTFSSGPLQGRSPPKCETQCLMQTFVPLQNFSFQQFRRRCIPDRQTDRQTADRQTDRQIHTYTQTANLMSPY